ncbi:MAG: CHASE2 domain-containing protein [Synechococcales bacterium]|nr:CHASE2 domain-containing protein [Synechococcales bacterium]
MDKVVALSLGTGDFASGFPAVTAQIWDRTTPHPVKFTAALPAAPQIPEFYRRWQLLYLSLHQRLDLGLRIEIEAADVTNVSEREFSDLCQQLAQAINDWLDAPSFCPVVQQLRTHLDIHEEIRFIFESNVRLLQRLPWHLWNFFNDYRHAEVALSTPTYQRSQTQVSPLVMPKPRVLAILGNSRGIDTAEDRACLEQLSDRAELTFLVEPTREELNQQLWQPWHIVFFAGHSFSQDTGTLQLNREDTLTLKQLCYGLKYAIAQGLKLAIFNSCDGLGLAQALADLHIPQVIVMREPVPDQVAQRFLRYFLASFASGKSLYRSVREARERLQGLEGIYPCATWLPVIFQNPAEDPPYWQDWYGGARLSAASNTSRAKPLSSVSTTLAAMRSVLLTSLMMTVMVMGVRHLGLLQGWELQAFDRLMRSRPDEPPDDRLLIVAITEDDFQLPVQQQRTGSLSDQAFIQLLNTLTALQPRAIGLDIYRNFPAQSLTAAQIQQIQSNNRLFAVCKVRDRQTHHPGIAPPPEVPLERQGFSDIVVDPDGVLRRHLLAMNPHPTSPCETPYALSAQLVFHYLAAEGMTAQFTSDQQLQMGDVVFERLHNRQGAYQGIDSWGYQILLNYRPHQSITGIARTVTLAEVLSGQLGVDDVKDRIVLIGVVATSAGDYLATPYSSGFAAYEEVPGVVVQAQMVSQLLSAVQDGRPLLTPLPRWADGLWVWGWAVVGGWVVCWGRSHPRLLVVPSLAILLVGSITIGAIYLTALALLTQGYWVPLVPAALAVVLTGGLPMALPPLSAACSRGFPLKAGQA